MIYKSENKEKHVPNTHQIWTVNGRYWPRPITISSLNSSSLSLSTIVTVAWIASKSITMDTDSFCVVTAFQAATLCQKALQWRYFVDCECQIHNVQIVFTSDEQNTSMGFEARYRMVPNMPIPSPEFHHMSGGKGDRPELRMAQPNRPELCGNPFVSPAHVRKIWGGGPISNSQWPWLGNAFWLFDYIIEPRRDTSCY